MKPSEKKYYGINACKAIFQVRPDHIIRVYLTEPNIKIFSNVLKWCAQQKKTYHVVKQEELDTIAGGQHHEGVCFLALEKQMVRTASFVQDLIEHRGTSVLILNNITNPHNIGAILRSCVHFGVRYVALDNEELSLSGALARVSEGGVEHITICKEKDLVYLIKSLQKAQYNVLACTMRAQSIYDAPFPKNCAIVLGNEGQGIEQHVRRVCDGSIAIPGTGKIDSLNVASAAAVVLAELYRNSGAARARKQEGEKPREYRDPKKPAGRRFNTGAKPFKGKPFRSRKDSKG